MLAVFFATNVTAQRKGNKPTPEKTRHGYFQLGVQVYGGALLNPWFDRDLSLAGRVSFESTNGSVS